MNRFAALIAALCMLAPAAALAGTERVGKDKTSQGAIIYSFEITPGWAIDDFTTAVPVCPATYIIYEKSAAAVVSAYGTKTTDDTTAEIEAGSLIQQFTASTTSTGPVLVTKGSMEVRFVVDTAETSTTIPTKIKVICSGLVSNGGGGGSGANLAASLASNQVTVTSDTGNDATIPASTTTNAGVMTAADRKKLDAMEQYSCEEYLDGGEDIGKACNDAYAAMVAARGGVLNLPAADFSGASAQTTKMDFCDETGLGAWKPVVLRGHGSSEANKGVTRIAAGSALATSNISRTNFTVAPDTDITGAASAVGYDRITCSGCDFVAYGLKRGDLIETTGFASANNNYGLNATTEIRKSPLKVQQVTATAIIVEGEINPGAEMAAVTGDTGGQIRKLQAQIEMCHMGQYVVDVEVNGDLTNRYADIGVHFKPDNFPQNACTAASTPYAYCTGNQTGNGSQSYPIIIGGGVIHSTVAYHKYANVALTAPATAGQADHFIVDESRLFTAPVSFWYDSEQAQPYPLVRSTQAASFERNGLRVASGTLRLDAVTSVSGESECQSDTYGLCSTVRMLSSSTVGLLINSSNLENHVGSAVVVESQTSAPRTLSIRDSYISAASAAFESSIPLLDAPGFCGVFVNDGNIWANHDAFTTAPTLTVANSNSANCPLIYSGVSTYKTYTANYPPPVLKLPTTVVDIGSYPGVDVRSASGPTHVNGSNIVYYSAIDGAKSLCTDTTPADGFCDADPTVRSGKTQNAIEEKVGVFQTQTEAYGDRVKVIAGGDVDPIGRTTDVWATGGSQDSGDEAPQSLRNYTTDTYYAAAGAISGTLAAGSGQATITVSGLTETESTQVGENKLLVFDTNASAGAVAEDVDLTSVPAGTIDTGVFSGGTWGTGTKTWGIEAGRIAGAGFGAGWCMSPANTIELDQGGAATREWFKIASCNSGANTCETSWTAQGTEYGIPYGTLAETGADEARFAPCVDIVEPLYNKGSDKVVDQIIVNRPTGFDGTSSGAGFFISDYPFHTANGVRSIVSRFHGTSEGHNGFLAANLVDGVLGRYQGKSAYAISNPGSLSNLVDGKVHGWEFGVQCQEQECETGFNYRYADSVPNEQAMALAFGSVDFAANQVEDVIRVLNVSNTLDLTLNPANGWGQNNDPFVLTSVGNAVYQAKDADLDDLADGTLSGSKVQTFGTSNAGVVGSSGGGTVNFLRADGAWASPAGSSAGDPVSIGGSPVGDGAGIDFEPDLGLAMAFDDTGSPDVATLGFEFLMTHTSLQTAPPGTMAEKCFLTTSGLGAGGFACEGPTDNTTQFYFTFPSPTDSGSDAEKFIVLEDAAQTLTNKTIDAEASGNVLTVSEMVWFPAAGCNNATATPFYDLPTSGAAAAACVTGTNTQKGALDFDAATDESGQITHLLASDWAGVVDVKIKWFSAATSGDAIWNIATACVADGETDDPAFNAASAVTDTAKASTNQTNDATISAVTMTGCSAGELLHVKISRDADNGSDSMTGDARLIGFELITRRAM